MSIYLLNVANFAVRAHGDQKRKYTGIPYACHPLDVAALVATVIQDEEVIAAALIHDVFEDTKATVEEAREACGPKAVAMALRLTNEPVRPGFNREKRKALDRDRLAASSWEVQTVKVADLICNAPDIRDNDPNFAVKYKQEAQALLDVLVLADIGLRGKLAAILATLP